MGANVRVQPPNVVFYTVQPRYTDLSINATHVTFIPPLGHAHQPISAEQATRGKQSVNLTGWVGSDGGGVGGEATGE